MDIRVLNYFLTVAREGSISAAAALFTYDTTSAFKTIKRIGRRTWKTIYLFVEIVDYTNRRRYDT